MDADRPPPPRPAPPGPPGKGTPWGKIAAIVGGILVAFLVLGVVGVGLITYFYTDKHEPSSGGNAAQGTDAPIANPAAEAQAKELARFESEDARLSVLDAQLKQKKIEYNEALGTEKALIARYPYAYQALLARHDAAATALKKDANLGDIFAGVLVGSVAQSYCNDHGEECEQLDSSLQQMKTREEKIQAEAADISAETGYKVRVSNGCANPVKVRMQVSDVIQGDVMQDYSLPVMQSVRLTSKGMSLRTNVSNVRYALMEPGSEVPFRVSEDTMTINSDQEFLLTLPCKR